MSKECNYCATEIEDHCRDCCDGQVIELLEEQVKTLKAENSSLKKQVKSLCVAHVDLTEIEQETERDNISLKSELEALRACTSQEIEIKALVLIGEIGAAVGNVYDTALHLTIGGMINQFNREAVASPRD